MVTLSKCVQYHEILVCTIMTVEIKEKLLKYTFFYIYI